MDILQWKNVSLLLAFAIIYLDSTGYSEFVIKIDIQSERIQLKV